MWCYFAGDLLFYGFCGLFVLIVLFDVLLVVGLVTWWLVWSLSSLFVSGVIGLCLLFMILFLIFARLILLVV